MSNEDWYYYDEKEERIKLTDKAPPEAVKNCEEILKLIDSQYKDEQQQAPYTIGCFFIGVIKKK